LLGLRVIDKDDILEGLFVSKGVGDAAWRSILSRESDAIFQREARSSDGAVLVSFWHMPGMSAGSGTPTGWLTELSEFLVNLHCECPVEIAAARFRARRRHPGHLDDTRSSEQILGSLRDIGRLEPLQIGDAVSVDTSTEISIEDLADNIARFFARATASKNRLRRSRTDQFDP
jgi:glucokinase